MIGVRRVGWHPASATVLIGGGAAAVAALSFAGGAGPWPWLVIGAAAGFATSGSV
jgi:hypothetical protein